MLLPTFPIGFSCFPIGANRPDPFGWTALGRSLRTLAKIAGGATLVLHGFASAWAAPAVPLRILPLGDSITRGTYLARYESGPRQGEAIGLPNPDGGGWRRLLQDQMRADGTAFDFVGELNYSSYGRDGMLDSYFDPDHHGLAGFGNKKIISGGKVPTLGDVLESLGVKEIVVPDIATVLRKHRPDVILLMSGANGFDAMARDELIRIIGANSKAHLFVASILPQRAPRDGWEKVADYNASLPTVVAAQKAAGHRVTFVEMNHAVSADDLLADGVHPNRSGLARIAETWFRALREAEFTGRGQRPNSIPP